jgi:transglutaminase-like putative cysteine protease/protocatechuate 3,4-dioxygenase beta subunit
MRGKKYQALIVAILLLTALPYSPFLSRASSIEKNPLAETDIDGDGIPDPPFRDSDGDGLSDDYEISLGFDPNDFDMDGDGLSDMAEMDLWDGVQNMDWVPPNLEDLYGCDGDLDGDGINNCMDFDADGDGLPDMDEMADMDLDGIPDMYENMIDHLDPNNPDSDGDGIPDMDDNDPPLPPWAEDMSKNNDWTPQPDCNGCSGNPEAFYPLAMLMAVKFTVTCDTCQEPTANPQYWRTVGKTIYDNGYDPITDTYSRNQWCPAPGCEQYGIDTGIVDDPGYWSTGNTPYTYDYLITNPEITSEQHTYTITWVMPASGYLSTALYTNSVFISNSVTMDSAFNLHLEGYAQSYTFTMTEYSIPDSVKQVANAPNDFSSKLTEVPNFPLRPGPDNDVYDLAASITEGITSDYEKAVAIRDYLRNNYYYNINGTMTPEGDDYIDYFLFGNPGQDGKCTNFASAFTILSRLNNIPTRYVTGNGIGDVVTPEEWENTGYGESTGYSIEKDTRVVTMLHGHAYAEVLLDGIGWLTFEPTSSNQCPTCDGNSATNTGEDNTVEGEGTQPGTEHEINDSDGDGLSDEYENGIGTDPYEVDTDQDGLWDGVETNSGTFVDTDSDTGTDPLSKDTDKDGLEDDDEILGRYSFYTHPLDSDTDNDGLTDGQEVHEYGTSPMDNDSDNDGLTDGLEVGITLNDIWAEIEYNLLPCLTKTGSTLTNCQVAWQPDEDGNSTTNPLIKDSDFDGLNDGEEDHNKNGKLDAYDEEDEPCVDGKPSSETDPTLKDTDGGGQYDLKECATDSTDPRNGDDDVRDSDGDGLFDHVEDENCVYGISKNQCTNSTSIDTDQDGINDFDEIFNCLYGENNDECTDPTLEDTDRDTINDDLEIFNCFYGENNDECTDPTLEDTDGGGANDGLEIVTDFTNPLNKTDDIQQADRDDDEDGLTNGDEDINGNGIFEPELGETDSQDNDTDDDGLNDGEEKIQDTDPLNPDSDDDGLSDGEEVSNLTWGPTNPLDSDSDDDGLNDGEEVESWTYCANEDQFCVFDGMKTVRYGIDDTWTYQIKIDGTGCNNAVFGDPVPGIEKECYYGSQGYGTNPNVADSDGDGLSDGDEVNIWNTNPIKTDTDNDGLNDGEEINTYETDPNNRDSDDDELSDGDEIKTHETDPNDDDSDFDGLTDGDEVNTHETDPNDDDSDSDGLDDWAELFNTTWGPTNPIVADTDGGGQKDGLEVLVDGTDPNDGSDDDLSAFDDDDDGLTNGEEENIYFTDPNDADTDDDGLNDGEEVNIWNTNPLKIDSDYDGIEDGTETINCIYGEDENECTSPTDDDSDNDGLEDGHELNLTSDPKNNDSDNDGLSDSAEVNNCIYGEANDECTSLINNDSDNDNLTDGDEVEIHFTNPMDNDTDNDQIWDGVEAMNCIYGGNDDECTNPNIFDSDGDTIGDGDEVYFYGSDPKDTDTDDDNLGDATEITNCIYGENEDECTSPTNDDSDYDEVNDYDEIFNCIYGEADDECTDPREWDSDDDALNDGDEINIRGTDPMDNDTDDDGLSDSFEISFDGGYYTDPTKADTDDDEINDYDEINNCIYGTNDDECTDPTLIDTDNDGINDNIEIDNCVYGTNDDECTNPTLRDSDNDNLTDGDEISENPYQTDPLLIDTDSGGRIDSLEIDIDETDPTDPSDDFIEMNDDDEDGLTNGQELYVYQTDPNDSDSDDDGLDDYNETMIIFSNPNNNDTDNDGLTDYIEWYNTIYGENNNEGTSPNNADSDSDGINDYDEITNCIYGEDGQQCTDPKDLDSDDDNADDGAEINIHLTDPKDSDSDDDGLPDSWEVYDYNLFTDPNDPDSDDDLLSDYDEFMTYFTDPNDPDSDDDAINDYIEITNCIYGEDNNQCTNPNDEDSDGDGLDDYVEIITHNTDPKDYDTDDDSLNDGYEINTLESNPLNIDSDSDGLNDTWEVIRATQGYLYSLINEDSDDDGTLDGDEDLDNDGLTNLDEIQGNRGYITDPLDSDTDDDTLFDGDEIDPQNINKDGINNQYNYASDPTKVDSDDDLLSDLEEVLPSNDTYESRTNPKDSDTDGDGLTDYEEVSYYWNITGDDNNRKLYYDVQGWNTSDAREENTDEDFWEDGDDDEENPVYGYYEEEDPPWGSPPSRAGTPQAPPESVNKTDEFIWSSEIVDDIPYEGVLVYAYLNETNETDSPSYLIGQGITDVDGFFEVICNISSLESSLSAGDWIIQLQRPYQTYNATVNLKESWSPAREIKVIGNSLIDLDLPEDFTGSSGQTSIITGKLFENDNLPIENEYIELIVENIGTYYQSTNEDGSFAIQIDLPETEDEQTIALFFKYNGTENVTESRITAYLRVINASVDLTFDEQNVNILELNQTYSIKGSIAGDELEEPTGNILLDYSGTNLGETEITGNQNWEINITIPANSTWGESILKATYSGDSFHPSGVVISYIIVKGESSITIEDIERLRTENIKLEGNLTDHNGEGIPEYTVNLYFNDNIIGSAITNSEGRYSFSDNDFSEENNGQHSISVRLLDSQTLIGSIDYANINLIATPSIIFDLDAKCYMTAIEEDEWDCKAKRNQEYVIKGTVVDELGIPIEGALVEFINKEEDVRYEQLTNETGQFEFTMDIPAGETEELDVEINVLDSNSISDMDNELTIIPQSEIDISININDAHRGENVTITGSVNDDDSIPVVGETIGIYVAGSEYYIETNDQGLFTLNHTLVSNYKLGLDNVTAVFNETNTYLGNQTNGTFAVYGSSYFDSIRVEGDWFNGEIIRGGDIVATGILVDDLGYRINGNISGAIGSRELTLIFTNETTFVASGIVPETYRNNHTLELKYGGSEFIYGNVYKSKESILVPTKITFDFNPTSVFAGDNVNVSLWLKEDDNSPLSQANINVTIKKLFINQNSGKPIESLLEKETTLSFTTNSNGLVEFNFTFPHNATSVTIEIMFEGGYLSHFDDTPYETKFTESNIAISITKSPVPVPPFDFDKYIPLFIGIPAALLVTGYYLYWTQKHKYEVRNLIKQMQKELNKDEDYRQIIIKSYHQLLNILSRYGFIKTKTQTVREFTDVMAKALPIPEYSVKLLTSLFEIARYSGIKPKIVDEFGMEMIDGSYNIWCVEAINSLHQVENDLNTGLKEGKVSRFTNIFGMRRSK